MKGLLFIQVEELAKRRTTKREFSMATGKENILRYKHLGDTQCVSNEAILVVDIEPTNETIIPVDIYEIDEQLYVQAKDVMSGY